MEIRIGYNIKRLRKEKNMTQEQLAEVLGISVTAVSKWERNDTYPDITLLFPLAHYFGVTLDELMGYDEEKVRADIEARLKEYRSLWLSEPEKAQECIREAYAEYPNDYWVMHYYMWNIAGDMADNEAEVLLSHKEEFEAICEKILEGCKEETLRLNAWNMKAKLLHAQGRTEEALRVYEERFPNWYAACDQKKEQLFAKDTPEFMRQLCINRLELANFSLDKKMKEIWFCKGRSTEERIQASLQLAEALKVFGTSTKSEETPLLLYTVYHCLWGYVKRFGAGEKAEAEILAKKEETKQQCKHLAEEKEVYKAYGDKRYPGEFL